MKMRLKYMLVFVLFLAACAAGVSCARYAPVPQEAPKRHYLDITLKTEAALSNSYYYYIAFDFSGDTSLNGGPYADLSGVDRMKNWTYYIVYNNGQFKEKSIASATDTYILPGIFDAASPRFYSASAASDTIRIVMYLEGLAPTARYVRMNFVTSAVPVTDNVPTIQYIDYLPKPYAGLNSTTYNYAVSDVTTHTIYDVPDPAFSAADIKSWSVFTEYK